ncbi:MULTISPECIES: nitroreductase family protein [unclassified Bosea (in: a-proteobacteria)]|uniref:nitroreductase family protein n=1 Tax=unclassified Bosea (in: a-proteobacteria) TaxID=2653178 RepID=UPI000F7608BD|nr:MULTISPECIES: nitroreductase family protein [unclassified Bosea (in: a-proteobacteria)]AZO80813.1 nitroreductase [Bosea sp. Tri-49]RXT25777.1 nitroreductase family protein [Bosea sp. Tri-39]RXT31019.1 nitroreductase family protein [Bosea sp. Tri-54]
MLDKLKRRRTQYALGKNLPISETQVDGLIREAIRLAPSSFNSQSSRAVILFGKESDKFWSIAREALRAIVPAADFEGTAKKIDGFASGAGTVLFFEDQEPVKALQANFPLYAHNFPIWSEHSTGMAQLAVWTTLADVGIGASLQHYHPLVDADVAKTWNIPASWKLTAQMPFGSNEAAFQEKTFIDDELRFRTHR